MTNEEYKTWVSQLSVFEWIREVLQNPEFLTDWYYRDLGLALHKRGETLLEERA